MMVQFSGSSDTRPPGSPVCFRYSYGQHRPYQRSGINETHIVREHVRGIKGKSPPHLINHVLFQLLEEHPKIFLTKHSRTLCLNATRH